MSDEADMSDGRIEAAVTEGISRVRRQTSLRHTGECHFCGEEVAAPLTFCDSNCRDDYDAEQRAKARRGG